MAGFLLIAASLVLAPAAEARNARKAHAAQSTASRQILNVRSAVLMDARTGKILYSQNPDVRIPPASLTKIMSMMVTFDAIRSGKVKLSDQIRVSRHAARQGGSRMGLRAGERVSLNRLLMGMAVSSGNDASMAVAERVGGSGRAFVKMMNNKARQIGMSSSTFKTPNGLPAAGQYTTARDMARLGYVYLKNNPSALQYHRVRVLKHRGAVTTNKNPLLGACPGADGLKTGWVTASGYNIISTVRRGNTRLIAVILGADSAGLRSHEVRRLVEAGFKSRTNGITVASALTKYSYPNKATASSVKKHKIRRNKATAQASRRTGRSSKIVEGRGNFLQKVSPPFHKPHPSPSKTFDLIESLMESHQPLKGKRCSLEIRNTSLSFNPAAIPARGVKPFQRILIRLFFLSRLSRSPILTFFFFNHIIGSYSRFRMLRNGG